ncbi:methyltransferase family protein [Algoriphagus boseongensis]|uniref:Methyltransferase family protein n=1 Tax=Algoriphagus boseongensis TaxID=1442587 RepID=A0A4R6T7A0_9BACT|nr:methyltransferase domain-containing protein [Algoriphagus boseongensis]TDQ18880.1 methyltransferase family protein [Algoriphagus boseongensis]
MSKAPSCKIEDKTKSCCSSTLALEEKPFLAGHWDQAYLKSPEDKLGWFENDFSPSFKLIDQCELNSGDPIVFVGSGSSRLPDQLLEKGISNLWITDISEVAIQEVKDRMGDKIKYGVGDILSPQTLENIPPVQLWFDRAVLHFFTEKEDQDLYFDQLKNKLKPGGYVIFAEFHLSGAEKCSGLPVFRYEEKMYQERLGEEFKLMDTFIHNYLMPSGQVRPYSYALYQRIKE